MFRHDKQKEVRMSARIPSVICTVLAVASAMLLSACSSKPPGCADEQTLAVLSKIVTDNITKKAVAFNGQLPDADGLVAAAMKAIKLDVVNITNEGYASESRKQACRATIKAAWAQGSAPSDFHANMALELPVAYATQRMEGKQADDFLVQINSDVSLVTDQLASGVAEYVSARRWAGEWTGTYACGGVNDASEGNQGPMSFPVTLVVPVGANAKGLLERTTKGGGVEKLQADMGAEVTLSGGGANSAEDRWDTLFRGAIKDNRLRASGLLTVAGESLVRKCTLDLTRRIAH